MKVDVRFRFARRPREAKFKRGLSSGSTTPERAVQLLDERGEGKRDVREYNSWASETIPGRAEQLRDERDNSWTSGERARGVREYNSGTSGDGDGRKHRSNHYRIVKEPQEISFVHDYLRSRFPSSMSATQR